MTLLSFNWRDDPPHAIRALLQNLMHNALSLIVLHYFVVALLYLYPRPRIEVLTLQQLRPIVLSSTSLHRSSDQCACQMQSCRSLAGGPILHRTATPLASFFPVAVHVFGCVPLHTLFSNPVAPKQADSLPRELFSPAMIFHRLQLTAGSFRSSYRKL